LCFCQHANNFTHGITKDDKTAAETLRLRAEFSIFRKTANVTGGFLSKTQQLRNKI
jgi:hypothetical protein